MVQCVGFIDENVLEKLFPRLLELLKENISFSTRSAAINFVILLTKSMDVQQLQPFVGKEWTISFFVSFHSTYSVVRIYF